MKKYVLLILLVIIIGIASAETFRQNDVIDFKKTCTNSTGFACATGSSCNITIKQPLTNNYIVNSKPMSNNGYGTFNYTLPSSNTSFLGTYTWDMFCCTQNECGESHGEYKITKTGVELTQDKALIYLGMLVIIIFFLYVSAKGITLIPKGNNKDDDGYFIGVNNLKYLKPVLYVICWILIVVIAFMSSNIAFLFLEDTMIGSFFFKLYQMMFYLTLPMITIWFIYIFVMIFKDRELKNMLERGVFTKESP